MTPNPLVTTLFEHFRARGEPLWLVDEPAHDVLAGRPCERYPALHFVVDRVPPWLAGDLPALLPEAGALREGRQASFSCGGTEVLLAPRREHLPPSLPLSAAAFSPIELDLATREVTVRAVAVDATGAVVDPFGGVADHQAGLLRLVAPAKACLALSAGWIFKVARHAAGGAWTVDPEFERAARQVYFNLVGFRPAWMREQLTQVLVTSRTPAGLDLLASSRALAVLLPELDTGRSAWPRTVQAVLDAPPEPVARWTALLSGMAAPPGAARRFLFRGLATRLELREAERDAIDEGLAVPRPGAAGAPLAEVLDVAGRAGLTGLPGPAVPCDGAFEALLEQPERVREALERLLVSMTHPAGFEHLSASGALAVLLPEVQALRGFDRSSPLHHKDLWDHTLRVVLQAPPEVGLRWVALLHDVGKVTTRRIQAGRVRFLRHEDIGAWLFRGLAARLAFDPAEAARIEYLIAHHSRINHYGEEWTDTAIRRLARDTEHLDDLLAFSRADMTSRIPGRVAELRQRLDTLQARMHEISERDAAPPLLPKGLGNALMERFALKPGPLIGRLRDHVEGEVQAGRLEQNADVGYYIDYFERQPELLDQMGITP